MIAASEPRSKVKIRRLAQNKLWLLCEMMIGATSTNDWCIPPPLSPPFGSPFHFFEMWLIYTSCFDPSGATCPHWAPKDSVHLQLELQHHHMQSNAHNRNHKQWWQRVRGEGGEVKGKK